MDYSIIATEIEKKSGTANRSLRVAIQGVAGAFHDIAARHFFHDKNVAVIPSSTFGNLTEAVLKGQDSDIGLMAIENSLVGSIMGNYQLLLESGLKVTGEIYLRIQQNLMALPGQHINDLTEVHSHPMAIAQCRPFFKKYPQVQLVEAVDTALSAKALSEENQAGRGAIASSLAAKMYGLEILASSIETNKQNYTRFLVLQRESEVSLSGSANKASLCFAVPHEVGSLHRVLGEMANHNLNLTKIESSPIKGKTWEYYFFIDFTWGEQVQWQQCIAALRPFTADLQILGVYPEGKHVEA